MPRADCGHNTRCTPVLRNTRPLTGGLRPKLLCQVEPRTINMAPPDEYVCCESARRSPIACIISMSCQHNVLVSRFVTPLLNTAVNRSGPTLGDWSTDSAKKPPLGGVACHTSVPIIARIIMSRECGRDFQRRPLVDAEIRKRMFKSSIIH